MVVTDVSKRSAILGDGHDAFCHPGQLQVALARRGVGPRRTNRNLSFRPLTSWRKNRLSGLNTGGSESLYTAICAPVAASNEVNGAKVSDRDQSAVRRKAGMKNRDSRIALTAGESPVRWQRSRS